MIDVQDYRIRVWRVAAEKAAQEVLDCFPHERFPKLETETLDQYVDRMEGLLRRARGRYDVARNELAAASAARALEQ